MAKNVKFDISDSVVVQCAVGKTRQQDILAEVKAVTGFEPNIFWLRGKLAQAITHGYLVMNYAVGPNVPGEQKPSEKPSHAGAPRGPRPSYDRQVLDFLAAAPGSPAEAVAKAVGITKGTATAVLERHVGFGTVVQTDGLFSRA